MSRRGRQTGGDLLLSIIMTAIVEGLLRLFASRFDERPSRRPSVIEDDPRLLPAETFVFAAQKDDPDDPPLTVEIWRPTPDWTTPIVIERKGSA